MKILGSREGLSAFLVGTFLTALVQSSTAIGSDGWLVNAGLMSFPQAVGIIYGANIGTTISLSSFSVSTSSSPICSAGSRSFTQLLEEEGTLHRRCRYGVRRYVLGP